MWLTCETLFIGRDINDKKEIAFSEFFVLAVSWTTTVAKEL